MSDVTAIVGSPEELESRPAPDTTPVVPEDKPKKVFTRDDIRTTVSVRVHLPELYKDYEPWEFELGIKLSKDAENDRQEYLNLAAVEMTKKAPDQALNEICDLLRAKPKGFGDLQDTGQGAGPSFRNYVETAPPDAKDLLYTIVEGADSLYWRYISPREFRD